MNIGKNCSRALDDQDRRKLAEILDSACPTHWEMLEDLGVDDLFDHLPTRNEIRRLLVESAASASEPPPVVRRGPGRAVGCVTLRVTAVRLKGGARKR